jgi:hypothetical protein
MTTLQNFWRSLPGWAKGAARIILVAAAAYGVLSGTIDLGGLLK